VDDDRPGPLVLVHCGWPRDRELIAGLVREAGAEVCPTPAPPELRRLLAEDRLDAVVADSKGGRGPLGDLLQVLDDTPDARDLPLVLLADPEEADELSALSARRPGAVVQTKPVSPRQLQDVVRSGLRYWAGRRENRELVRRLGEERRRYHDLVQGIDAIAWEADAATCRFTFVSRRAEEMFGYPVERWLADPEFWAGCVHPEDRGYAAATRRRGLSEGRDFELEYRASAADGRVVWVREAVRPALDGSGRPVGLRGLVWNISRRKKAERQLYTARRELAEQLADMTHLHELTTRLTATLELEPTLDEILGGVMGVLGAGSGAIWLHDPTRGELRAAASAGLDGVGLDLAGPVPVGLGLCGGAAARRETVAIPDLSADEADAPDILAARRAGFAAAFCTPLVARGGDLVGTISAYFEEPHRPGERQWRLVELYARQAADFVEHARAHRGLLAARRTAEV